MPQYLIVFNAEWVPELTQDQLSDAARRTTALCAEMEEAGVWVFGAGLDDGSLVGGVDLVDGRPVLLDGPYAETKEHLGGFAVVDVPDDEAARFWAGRLATVLDWPQEVHRFPRRMGLNGEH